MDNLFYIDKRGIWQNGGKDWQLIVMHGGDSVVGWSEKQPLWKRLWYRGCEKMGWRKPYFAMKDWKI